MIRQRPSQDSFAENIVLFTNTYPHGTGETFLHEEIPFLARGFGRIVIFPLYNPDRQEDRNGNGAGPASPNLAGPEDRIKELPSNVIVKQPLLSFDHKNKFRLLLGAARYTVTGTFRYGCMAAMILKEMVRRKPFLSGKKLWIFFNYLFLLRSILGNRSIMQEAEKEMSAARTAYFYWGDKTALAVPFFKKRLRRKNNGELPVFAVRFHGSDLYEEAKGYLPFRETLYRSIDYALPVSRHGADYIYTRYPDSQPSRIIPCRLGSLSPAIPPQENAGEKSSGHTLHIVSCSNVIGLKRVELIAQTFCSLATDLQAQDKIKALGYERLRWTHLGDGPMLEKIKEICRSLPHSCGPVLFTVSFPGRIPHNRVLEFYTSNRPDLFIQASRSEGIPVAIMEALSCSIPILATDVGGTKEIFASAPFPQTAEGGVPNTDIGILLPENLTVEILKSKLLEELSLSPQERAVQKENARRIWETSWNAEKNYTEFVRLLRSLNL